MSVGKVGGGRKGGGAGAAKGAGGAAPAAKTGGAGFVDRVDRFEPASGVAPSAGGSIGASDPITAHALLIASQYQSGLIKTKQEATRRLVAKILKEKVRMQSEALTKKISETLEDDPRLSQALERLWTKAG